MCVIHLTNPGCRIKVDWVPVSNCSCPHMYLYVVVLELEQTNNFKQTNDVSKKTGEDNNKLGLEPRLGIKSKTRYYSEKYNSYTKFGSYSSDIMNAGIVYHISTLVRHAE